MSTPLSRQMDQMADAQEWRERAQAAEVEVERLRGAGQLLLDAYGEAHALYDLGECEGSLKMRAALRGGK